MSSPTVITELILMTATIESEEGKDVATVDIPNAFIQTPIKTEGTAKIIKKIRCPLVNILVQLDPDHYGPKVTIEGSGRNKVLYVQVYKAIYGMLQSALLFYKKLRKDLEGIGFKVNPYDPCVANRTI